MERISVAEAGRQFDELIDRVSREGVSVELEKDNRVIARLSPARRRLRVADLIHVFSSFPSLGDDAGSFAKDVERIRHEVPRESDPSSIRTYSYIGNVVDMRLIFLLGKNLETPRSALSQLPIY